MIRLLLVLSDLSYLRGRARALGWVGFAFIAAGIGLVVDALDGELYFPLQFFALLLMAGGVGALSVGAVSSGALRVGRLIEGAAFVAVAALVLSGQHRGGFWLSMLLGAMFVCDGLLQCVSAYVVRYPRWRMALLGGLLELGIATMFFSPVPFRYEGTVPLALGMALIFVGWGVAWIASRLRSLPEGMDLDQLVHGALYRAYADPPPLDEPVPAGVEGAQSVTVHVWLPGGAASAPLQRRPLIGRYVAAVDAQGLVWTGHAALEGPGGLYISFDPAAPIKRAVDDLRVLHAAPYNDVPGEFRIDHERDAALRGPSSVQVELRNIDGAALHRFWQRYRRNSTYNLTRRNCAVSVARALEAGAEGALCRLPGRRAGWGMLVALLLTPELWIAAQLRKRAKTMAWTPGLVLDYARALGLLVDPPRGGFLRLGGRWRAARRGDVRVLEKDGPLT